LVFIHIEHICTFLVTFFSATIDDRDLIFGHKLHIGTPYRGKRLDPSDSYLLFADFVDFYTHWTYMLIFRRIFLSNYWWQKSDIWSQASYRYTILWVVFLDPSDSYFLFSDLVGFYTHWTYMYIFRHIFLSSYWWQRSDIWSLASYRYPISWEALLIFMHIEHIFCICKRFLIRQIPTSCLPKSGGSSCWCCYPFDYVNNNQFRIPERKV
jgi:hypothetical protein